MEELDDDFGDLYADVQITATSSLNALHNSSHLCNTQLPHSPLKKNVDSSCERPLHSSHAFEDQKISIQESHRLAYYHTDTSDDDDDDLKIVLNDDRNVVAAPVISVNGGLNADEENRDFDGYDDAGELQRKENPDYRLLSPNGGAKTDYKYSSLHTMRSQANGLSANVEGQDSALAQNCLAFSLPWYRTIFDVNIDTFEHKPWTLPSADASNYFNFGFDEESWKHYCNQLDNLRRIKPTLSDHSSRLKAYEVGASAHGEELKEASSAFLNESQGRVIQVGNCSIERLPSIGTKWSTDRDSEAIQIVLKDFVEDSSGKMALNEKDDSPHKVSKDVDYLMDDEKITCSVNELSRDSLDSLVPKSSSTTPGDMDVLGSKRHKDVDWHHDENPNLSKSQEKAEPTQISDNSMDKDDKDSCKTVLSMEGIESLLQEPVLSSPSHSSSAIHCALSNDTVYNKNVKSFLNKEKSVDCEYYDRKRSRRSPVSKNLERYSKEGDRSSEKKNSSAYDAEGIYNLYHSKAGNTSRDNTRVYRTNCYNREDAIHHKRYDHLNSNNEKAFDWQKNHIASSRRSSRDEEELPLLRRWNDTQYLHGKNLSNYAGVFIENPPKRKEYRKLFPNDSLYMDNKSSHWRKNGERFQFREAVTEDDERYGFYDKKRRFLDGKYESPYMSIGDTFFDEGDYRRYSDNKSPHPYSDLDNLDYMPRRSDWPSSPRRDGRCNRQIRVDRSRESVQYRHLDYDFPEEGRLNYPYSERRVSLHWPENVHNSRWRDDDFLSEEALFSVGRSSKQHEKVGRQWKFVNDRVEGRQCKFNQQNGEGNSGYQLHRNAITSHRGDDDDDNHKEIPSKCTDFQFIGVGGKVKFDEAKVRNLQSCRGCCDSGRINCVHNNRYEKRMVYGVQSESLSEKAAAAGAVNKMNPVTEKNTECGSDVEEGQIVSEELLKEETKPINNQRIVEMRAKMEKRRERFMEPVVVSKKNEANMNKKRVVIRRGAEFVDTSESAEANKQERPVRKRRWGGN